MSFRQGQEPCSAGRQPHRPQGSGQCFSRLCEDGRGAFLGEAQSHSAVDTITIGSFENDSAEKTLNVAIVWALLLVSVPAALVTADEPVDICTIPNFTFEFEVDAEGNPIGSGTVVAEQYAAYGIRIENKGNGGADWSNPSNHPAMIFASSPETTAELTDGDDGLGTPNQAFPHPNFPASNGPGVGGASGPAANVAALDNILIISEDGDSSGPNDMAGGGIIRPTFDTAQHIRFVETLDIEETTGGTVSVYDASDALIMSVPMETYGNNSYQQVSLLAGGVYGMDVEFVGSGAVPGIAFCEDMPTAIELGGFEASAKDGAIELVWETAAELDTTGFNVYRAESANGPRIALNSSLIASQAPGSPLGATYRFLDSTARPWVTYYYWLQELDTSFEAVEYGLVTAEL
jgi:hypothetical protein